MRWSTGRLHHWLRRRVGANDKQRPEPSQETQQGWYRHLRAALDNLSQGFAFFGGDQQLIVCNKAYAEIYGLPPELTIAGTPLRTILEYRSSRGIYSGDDPETYIRRVMALTAGGRPATIEYVHPDGRIISVSHRPMAGGAWVSTHEDITARRRADQESQLRIQTKNLQLDAAISNMSHGLAMFDRDQKLIVCNHLYAELFGLPPEQLGAMLFKGEHVRRQASRGLMWLTLARDSAVAAADAWIAELYDSAFKQATDDERAVALIYLERWMKHRRD